MGIDIVSGCQLQCIGCPNSTLKKKPEFMSLQALGTCLENIDVDVKLLRLFNFGEALLHPRFVDMVKLINEWGRYKKLEVSTNGQWGVSAFAKLNKVKIDRLVVSCDGEGTKESYEGIRKGADWDKLLAFLKDGKYCAPFAQHVIRSITLTDKGKKWWQRNITGWQFNFRGWIPMPRSMCNPSGKINFKSKGSCEHMDTDNLYVDWNGTVGPCCNYPNAFYIGNLMAQKASYLVKHKRDLRLKMAEKRWGVCRECAM